MLRFLLLLPLLSACAAQPAQNWSARIEPDARFRDGTQVAVVRIGNHCSGTVVSPRHVLTAAHCLPLDWEEEAVSPTHAYPPAFVEVTIAGTRFQTTACAVHPGAYPGFDACRGRPDQNVVRPHDLALLTLEEDAPVVAVPIEFAEDRTLPDHIWLVGWHRRPRRRGALHRYSGQARVISLHDDLLTVQSTGEDPSSSFRTHGGNSGGPALADIDGRSALVGVLSAHQFTRARRSFYASTQAPDNADWLRSALSSSATAR